MKRGIRGTLILSAIIFVFLLSGTFAAPPADESCDISLRAECVAADGNYIIMGLSSQTSAHGEFPDSGTYPYVLCCGFGTGNKNCISSPSNKLLGLSSMTNAHAESPTETNYLTNVCYEDLNCRASTDSCGTGGVLSYGINLTSLSSMTNAHVGRIDDYPVKICCSSAKFADCDLVSASWNVEDAIEGQRVYLTATGSGPECSGQSVTFQVFGGFETIELNATNVAFNAEGIATSAWVAEWQSGGLFGGNPQFSFTASLAGTSDSITSSNQLTVSQTDIVGVCADITTCGDYADEAQCGSDASLCEVAGGSSIPGVNCDSPSIFCSCFWDNSTDTCEFGYGEIESPLCESGYTLCNNAVTGIDYCYPGSTCLVNEEPISDGDSVCELSEGCSSPDCSDGDTDSCVSGATCSSGMCYSATATATNVTCNYGFTLCRTSGTNYCYPGNECPVGQEPISDGDTICELGEGCLSEDCVEGGQDSCTNGLYCVTGECSSVEAPINLIQGLGGCKISQTVEKNCNEEPVGYKTIQWTGTWTGNGTTGDSYTRCVTGGRSTIPCPAQVQLPFFTYVQIIIAVVVIALIYVSIVLKKKKK
jgi:hypothetical protein